MIDVVKPSGAPAVSPESALPGGDLVRLFLDYLTVEAGLAANTILAYRRDLVRFLLSLDGAGRAVTDTTALDVQNHLRQLKQSQLAISSISRALVAIKMFLRYLVSTARVNRDITDALDSPRRWLPALLRQRILGAGRAGRPAGPGGDRNLPDRSSPETGSTGRQRRYGQWQSGRRGPVPVRPGAPARSDGGVADRQAGGPAGQTLPGERVPTPLEGGGTSGGSPHQPNGRHRLSV